jgi:tetraacyldisaccharide 4'-kinase
MDLFKRILLAPLSYIYGYIVGVRGALYDRGLLKSYESTLPVVSVGNITAGGNGKTPLCLAIAHELRERGYSPAILSRGYGGSIKGPHRVDLNDSYKMVGDEPILMAQAGFPVFVARRRVAGIKLIEQDPAINVVILDDGFQHRALNRVIDIVSIFVGSEKAISDLRRGALLPLGMFRESRERALKRADAVVLSSRMVANGDRLGEIQSQISNLLPSSAKVFGSSLSFDGVSRLEGGESVSPQVVYALAAIGNPDGFFSSLEALGFTVRERFVFPDHYPFRESEIRAVVDSHQDLLFVCTAKDAVKIRDLPAELRQRFAILSVRANIAQSDTFFSQIETSLRGHADKIVVKKSAGL